MGRADILGDPRGKKKRSGVVAALAVRNQNARISDKGKRGRKLKRKENEKEKRNRKGWERKEEGNTGTRF